MPSLLLAFVPSTSPGLFVHNNALTSKKPCHCRLLVHANYWLVVFHFSVNTFSTRFSPSPLLHVMSIMSVFQLFIFIQCFSYCCRRKKKIVLLSINIAKRPYRLANAAAAHYATPFSRFICCCRHYAACRDTCHILVCRAVQSAHHIRVWFIIVLTRRGEEFIEKALVTNSRQPAPRLRRRCRRCHMVHVAETAAIVHAITPPDAWYILRKRERQTSLGLISFVQNAYLLINHLLFTIERACLSGLVFIVQRQSIETTAVQMSSL